MESQLSQQMTISFVSSLLSTREFVFEIKNFKFASSKCYVYTAGFYYLN